MDDHINIQENEYQRPESQREQNRSITSARSSLNNTNIDNRPVSNEQINGHLFSTSKPAQCSLFKLAQEYVRSLGWKKCFFAPEHDRCYCTNCCSPSIPNVILAAGERYVLPREWVGFGLTVDPALADYHKLWTEWIVTYHGTSINAAESILANRQFLIPGDVLLNGSTLGIRPGHIPGKKHIYTSPSIRYASLHVYSIPYDFTSSSGKKYKAQLVFQCRQKPGTFKIQRETVGRAQDPICNFISNEEIEYFTEIRVSLVPYRLLVCLNEV